MSKAILEPKPKHKALDTYESHWKADGSPHDHAPEWAKYRTKMTSEFPLPYRGGKKDVLVEHIGKFVKKLDALRPDKDGPAYLGDKPELTWTYPVVKNV